MQVGAVGLAKGIPFSAYGESLIISVQSFIIMFLIWHFNKKIDAMEKMFVGLFFFLYTSILFVPGHLGVIGSHQLNIISGTTGVFSK